MIYSSILLDEFLTLSLVELMGCCRLLFTSYLFRVVSGPLSSWLLLQVEFDSDSGFLYEVM